MWIALAAFVALQIYFVQEMLAALMLFTGIFIVCAIVALVLYLVIEPAVGASAWRDTRPSVLWWRPRRSVKSSSAVHVQSLPSNRAGLVRAEKQGGSGNFVGGLASSLKDRIQKTLELLFLRNSQAFRERLP